MSNETALATFKGLSTLLRPRYTRGLLLEDDDLTAAVEYTRNSVRLLFRSLFGCGVICGLRVDAALTCEDRRVQVTVRKGVALDCLGNPIEVPQDQTLVFNPDCKPLPPEIWVTVCFLERNCRPRDVSCSPDEDSQVVHTRSQDGFEIRLSAQQPKCACSCVPPGSVTGSNKGSKDCCTDTTNPGGVTPNEAFDCYASHVAGECGCDCDCSCVVLGRVLIDLEAGTKIQVEGDSVRRFIRPVLLGQGQLVPLADGERLAKVAVNTSSPEGTSQTRSEVRDAAPIVTSPEVTPDTKAVSTPAQKVKANINK